MSTREYASLHATSKPTASRELAALARLGLPAVVGAGRATRCYVDLDGRAEAGSAAR